MQLRSVRVLCLVFLVVALRPFALAQAAPAAALDALFKDMWEDDLKRNPEFASALGDRRYNDQVTDNSPRAINDELARRREFLTRLSAIPTDGLNTQQRLSAELAQRELIETQEVARLKGWELPVGPAHGIHTDLPGRVADLPFETTKDYDDYIARLHKVPAQLRQASENLLAGIEDHRVQPASAVEKALKQTEELANQTPEASPFALPLKKFPAAVPAASRKRISAEVLDAIETDVLPAYVRFAKFLKFTEVPAAPQDGAPIADRPLPSEAAELHILELRARTKSTLDVKFDLKAFHDVIAANWQLPADMLDRRVDAWMAAAK